MKVGADKPTISGKQIEAVVYKVLLPSSLDEMPTYNAKGDRCQGCPLSRSVILEHQRGLRSPGDVAS